MEYNPESKSKSKRRMEEFLRDQPRSKTAYPDPPGDLYEQEAVIWRLTVEAMPSYWFTPESLPLLKQYCMSVANLDYLDDVMQKMRRENTPLTTMNKLANIIRQETRVMAGLSRNLRLAPCSRSNKKIAEQEYMRGPLRPNPTQEKPWGRSNSQ